MLGYLDTVIAFSVLMLGISLLITILNQAISAFFAHRGANLAWGLGVLFEHIDAATYPNIAAHAQALAEAVLAHPLVSDSTFSTSRTWMRLVKQYPSLLRVVRRWQFANAISPEDLAAILNHLANAMPPELPPAMAEEIRNALKTPSPLAARQGTLANEVYAAAGGAALALPLEKIVGAVQGVAGNLEAWFTRILDRVSQRFTMWMRIWTVLFAFLIAFVFCIDAFQLLSDFYSNSALRTGLVNDAAQMNDLAKRVLPAAGSAPDLQVLEQQAAQARAIMATASGLPKLTWRGWLKSGFNTRDSWKRLIGVLATALLLSLGAPFWFNALSSLTSLRPVLAAKQSPPPSK